MTFARITREQRDLLRRWIARGAAVDWGVSRLRRIALPVSPTPSRSDNGANLREGGAREGEREARGVSPEPGEEVGHRNLLTTSNRETL